VLLCYIFSGHNVLPPKLTELLRLYAYVRLLLVCPPSPFNFATDSGRSSIFSATEAILPCRYDVFLVHRCANRTSDFHGGMIGSVTKVTASQRHRCSTFNGSRAGMNLHKIYATKIICAVQWNRAMSTSSVRSVDLLLVQGGPKCWHTFGTP